MKPGVLVLENGRVFRGQLFGGDADSVGEVVFNTSMTGYQEVTSDPSYAGQIVVMTAPQMGNVGVNPDDDEAARPHCAGFVVRDLTVVTSNWRARGGFAEYLADHGIPAINGVDTRAVTRAIREGGAQRGVIASANEDIDRLIERARQAPSMEGQDLVSRVSCAENYTWSDAGWSAPDLPAPSATPATMKVVAYDFGIKREILRDLARIGCDLTVVPATTSAKEALALGPDGFFLSNGPGDPAAVPGVAEAVRELVDSGKPVFGICLGHQILSLALGAKTYKLPFGHHGGNHPVKDLATGKVEITSQNHGFAVDDQSLPDTLKVTHLNLYDNTVEGVVVDGAPVFGIQYHPEASPGPHDAAYLFERFAAAMRQS